MTKVKGGCLVGINGKIIECEILSSNEAREQTPGRPSGVNINGLPLGHVTETIRRVRSSLRQMGVDFGSHMLVSFTPLELYKLPSVDLAFAVCVLVHMGIITPEETEDAVFYGELDLRGDTRAVSGAICISRAAVMEGISKVYVPTIMAREAAAQPNVTVYGVDSLQQLVDHLSGKTLIEPTSSDYVVPTSMSYGGIDLSNIRGQQKGVRALEIAAAGGHHIGFHGPAGTGKTLLARALVGILPPMTLSEKLAVTSAHSAAGLTRGQGLIQNRPFRCPHPTASEQAIVGGGKPPLPGELTLAHHGVIMLDDVTEFRRATLEAMAQPVDDGGATLTRSGVKYPFPSAVQMVLASLPCPCGYRGDPRMSCRCLPEHVKPHLERLDTKLYKLVDIVCALDHVNPAAAAPGDSSAVVQARVIKAREMAYERWGGNVTNSQMVGASMNRAELTFLLALSSAMKVTDSLPLRRVARTIADLAGSEEVKREHLLEAFDLSRERVLGV